MAPNPDPKDPDPKPDPKPDDPKPDDPDAGAKKALEAERKARRDAEKRAKDAEDALAKAQDEGKSDSDKLTEQVAQLTKDLGDERVMRLRAEAASEHNLDAFAAKRLSGSTAEELAEEATEWAKNGHAVNPDATTEVDGEGKPDLSRSGRPAPNDLQGKGGEGSGVDVQKLVDSIPPTI